MNWLTSTGTTLRSIREARHAIDRSDPVLLHEELLRELTFHIEPELQAWLARISVRQALNDLRTRFPEEFARLEEKRKAGTLPDPTECLHNMLAQLRLAAI